MFLKISVDLHTALARASHPADGERPEEQMNIETCSEQVHEYRLSQELSGNISLHDNYLVKIK
jgi:hypothetical protein